MGELFHLAYLLLTLVVEANPAKPVQQLTLADFTQSDFCMAELWYVGFFARVFLVGNRGFFTKTYVFTNTESFLTRSLGRAQKHDEEFCRRRPLSCICRQGQPSGLEDLQKLQHAQSCFLGSPVYIVHTHGCCSCSDKREFSATNMHGFDGSKSHISEEGSTGLHSLFPKVFGGYA